MAKLKVKYRGNGSVGSVNGTIGRSASEICVLAYFPSIYRELSKTSG